MANKKANGVKAPKEIEKKAPDQIAENGATEKPQYKVPYVSARIDRMASDPRSRIKANVSVTIGNHFAVHGLKIYDAGEGKGPQVLYPAIKGSDGKFYEDFHPVTKEARDAINESVIEAYEQKLEEQSGLEDLDDEDDPVFEQTM